MKNDVYYPLQNLRYGYWSGDADTEREMISLFTDRSVYRPGQTLYFSGIDYRVGEKVGTVVPNGRYTVVLSAQGKDIARCTVQGDSFGSFTGSFVLPSDMVNGYCRIRVEGRNESLSVQVSEYKRPTFRILFEPVKDAVSLGSRWSRLTAKSSAFREFLFRERMFLIRCNVLRTVGGEIRVNR